MPTRPLATLTVLAVLTISALVSAEDEANVDFNFAYSAVLGTGYYSTGDERVLVLRIPFSWRFKPLNEKNRLKLLLPVAVGVRDIIDDDGLLEIPTQLLTASFLPGIAWERRVLANWVLVPTLQFGYAKDFQADTEAWLYSGALRSYAWWDIGRHRLGLGNRILGAGQEISGSDNQTGFVLVENGLDWEYPTPWAIAGRPLSSSVYLLWQHFADDVRINGVSGENVNITNLFQLGFTFGFRQSVSVLGLFPVSRVGFSMSRGNTVAGNEIIAYTLNLGFPLAYD